MSTVCNCIFAIKCFGSVSLETIFTENLNQLCERRSEFCRVSQN